MKSQLFSEKCAV